MNGQPERLHLKALLGLGACLLLLILFNVICSNPTFSRPDYPTHLALPESVAAAVLLTAIVLAGIVFLSVLVGLLSNSKLVLTAIEGGLGLVLSFLLTPILVPQPRLPTQSTPSGFSYNDSLLLYVPLKAGDSPSHQWSKDTFDPYLLVARNKRDVGDTLISHGRFASTRQDSIIAMGTFAGRSDVAAFVLPGSYINQYLTAIPFVSTSDITEGPCEDCLTTLSGETHPLIDALEAYENVTPDNWSWRFHATLSTSADSSRAMAPLTLTYWTRTKWGLKDFDEDVRSNIYGGLGKAIVLIILSSLFAVSLISLFRISIRQHAPAIIAVVVGLAAQLLSTRVAQPSSISVYRLPNNQIAFDIPMFKGNQPIHTWPVSGTPRLPLYEGGPPHEGVFLNRECDRALFVVSASEAIDRPLSLKPQVHLPLFERGHEQRLAVRFALISPVPQFWAGYPHEDSWQMRLERSVRGKYVSISRDDFKVAP